MRPTRKCLQLMTFIKLINGNFRKLFIYFVVVMIFQSISYRTIILLHYTIVSISNDFIFSPHRNVLNFKILISLSLWKRTRTYVAQ